MRLKKHIGFVISALLLLFCLNNCINSDDQNKSNLTKNNKQRYFTEDSCFISEEIYRTISDYIDRIDKKMRYPVYSCYFFVKNNKKYFSLWSFTDFPDYIEFINPELEFNYYTFLINKKEVVFINKKNDTFRNVYLPCKKNKNASYRLKEELVNNNINYDGPWYPVTYKIENKKSSIDVLKCDTLLFGILGEGFYDFERNCKNKMN